MNETNRCEYIINLYTKNKNKINPNNTVENELDYILTNITKQDNDIIYLYKFTTNNKYYVVNSNEPTIVPADDIMLFIFIWKLYRPKQTKDNLIKSIIKNTKKFMKTYPVFEDNTIDEELLKKFLYDLSENKDAEDKIMIARDGYIIKKLINESEKKDKDIYFKARLSCISNRRECNKVVQKGGAFLDFLGPLKYLIYVSFFPLWYLEHLSYKYLPKWMAWTVTGILEFIDIILGIISSLPIKLIPVVGEIAWVVDAVVTIYSFTRADIIGVVAGLISLIPIVDIGGGFIKGGGKLAKLIKFLFKPAEKLIKIGEKGIKIGEEVGEEGIKIGKKGTKFGISRTKKYLKKKTKEYLEKKAKQKAQELQDYLQQHAPELQAKLQAELAGEDNSSDMKEKTDKSYLLDALTE